MMESNKGCCVQPQNVSNVGTVELGVKTEEKKPKDLVSSKNLNIQGILANVRSLSELAPIVKNANEHISLFGYRYIFVEGHKGHLPIDALASRITELVGENFKFTSKGLKGGKKIARRIVNIYKRNDARTREMNFFTRWLCNIRDFFRNYRDTKKGIQERTCLADRWIHYGEDRKIFEYYTKNQYLKKFGKEPEGIGHVFTVLKVFGKHALGNGTWKRHDCSPRWPAPH